MRGVSRYLKVAPYKKRKLRSGEWIIISSSGDPLIIDDYALHILCKKEVNPDLFDLPFINVLKESGFLVENCNRHSIPEEPTSFKFKLFSLFTLVIGITSFLGAIYCLFNEGLPFSTSIDLLITEPFIGILSLVMFSTLTTFLHEGMHLIYSNSLIQDNKFKINMTKAIATVSMTHVWTWSILGRIVAILSGICLDLFFLFSLLVFSQRMYFEYTSLFESVLITRITWQFRVQNKTDIRLFLELISDDPFLFEQNTVPIKIMTLLGFLVNIFIILIWLVPLVNY
ncbi:hypothetical protein FL859_07275 [Listeria monocytogenes]|nr:hypothetical protein [Listeria monocytogenes]